MSVWIYHTNVVSQVTLLNISSACSLILSYVTPTNYILSVTYGTTPTASPNAAWNAIPAANFPALGKWNHYGISSSYGDTLNTTIFYINGIMSSPFAIGSPPTLLPTDLTVVLGDPLQSQNGYYREVKIWTRSLTSDEMIAEKYM